MDQNRSSPRWRKKACISCTVAKAKCTPFAEELCERCHRLTKECIFPEISSRQRKMKDGSRMERLEDKLERMETMLEILTGQGSASTTPSTSTPNSLPTIPPPIESENLPSATVNADVIDQGFISLEEAAQCIDRYRVDFISYFPFVLLPPSATLESLRKDHPFLLLAILVCTTYDYAPLQLRLSNEMKQQIVSRIVVRGEKNLDLLQGLLVHLAWYHYYFDPLHSRMYLTLQLCVTLLHELGLDRNPQNRRVKHRSEEGLNYGRNSPDRSSAERRAYLGAFFVASSLAMALRKRSSIQWTAYLEQCAETIQQENIAPTDKLIRTAIDLQKLVRRVSDGFGYDDVVNTEIRAESTAMMVTEAFKNELKTIKQTIPPDVSTSLWLRLEFEFVEVFVLEVALHNEYWGSQADDNNASSTLRPSILWNALEMTRNSLQNVNSIPNRHLFNVPFTIWAKFCYVLVVIMRVIFSNQEQVNMIPTHEDEPFRTGTGSEIPISWNPFLAAQFAKMPQLGIELQRRFAALVTEDSSPNGQPNTMSVFDNTMKILMHSFERQMNKFTSAQQSITLGGPSLTYQPLPPGAYGGSGVNFLATGAAADATQLQAQETGPFQDLLWDIMMQDFTVNPQLE